MTSAPEPWTPNSDIFNPRNTATASLTLPSDCSALLPEKPALPNGLAISRRVRFTVPATGTAALQARQVARPALTLILGAGEQAERLSRRIETCLAELVALAYTVTTGEDLLCCVWLDAEHVFLSVEHEEPMPRVASDITMGLSVVKAIADDYGTHRTDTGYQTWAAIDRG
ncbi:hypothetical protein ACFUC2_05145 [[Kitasatospora] papulosa]|uniref:hypothetical protein n=1 Tax=Streptomyces TaxID=1883 RepID=UPI0033214004